MLKKTLKGSESAGVTSMVGFPPSVVLSGALPVCAVLGGDALGTAEL